MRFRSVLAPAALLVAGCTAEAPPPQTAAEALRAYYATVREPLPAAPPGASLDRRAAVTRIAFGSCLEQNRPMGVLSRIAAERPDLFLMLGDNVYGDSDTTGSATLPSLSAAYATLAGRTEFRDFRAKVPMFATWDDHDYGQTDGGGSFAFKEHAERMFETFWGSDRAVRSRPGVQQELVIGPDGQRLQIILLDTRFFRSGLKALPWQSKPPTLGNYVPNPDPSATILGEEQWRWLGDALGTPADMRLIISSIQIVTDAHGYEKWGNFPHERERLYALLDAKGVDNALFLSGDRHQGGIYRSPRRPGLYEFTSSSLNFSYARAGVPWVEPDPARIGAIHSIENYGLIDIDWARRTLRLSLRDSRAPSSRSRMSGSAAGERLIQS